MEEEEILGVNLDELSTLFDNNSFLGGESFGWALSPYRNVVLNDDGVMVKDESVVLYIDALGDANLSSKMWFFQKKDPIDAYDEPEFSKENLFVKGLGKAIPGVPPFGIIALPWYEVENHDGDFNFASGDHLNVDAGSGEHLEHFCGHAGMTAHTDADDRELADVLIGQYVTEADVAAHAVYHALCFGHVWLVEGE